MIIKRYPLELGINLNINPKNWKSQFIIIDYFIINLIKE